MSFGFQPGNDHGRGRPQGARNKTSAQLRERLKARGDKDPAEFLSELVSDENEDKELRIAASAHLMPYYHSKLGAIPIPPDPTFMEIKLKNPDPTCIDQCVENITLLTKAKASGECSIEHADSLIADQKVILYAMLDQQKQITAEGGPPEQVIRIEGGLPRLPGTSIDMPPAASAMNGHAVDGPPGNDYNGGSPPTNEDP